MAISRPTLFILSTSYHPFVGGAEIAIQEVAKRLCDRLKIVIITSRFSRALPRHETLTEAEIIRVGLGMRYDKWLLPFLGCATVLRLHTTALRLHTAALRKKNDLPAQADTLLLWGMDISQGSLAGALCKILVPRSFFIVTVQYGYGDERLATGRLGMLNIAFRFLLNRADRVTVISSYLKDIVMRYGYKGPLDVIHNGVDLEQFTLRRKRSQSSLRRIITTSRLIPKNGIDVLIDAFRIVKDSFPKVKLLIVGDGDDRRKLERRAQQLRISHDIEFRGSVSYDAIPGLLGDSDVFVRLSRSEGMGNSFIEALAAGLPIVGTPVGGIPDIIEDGKTGLFARVDDPADAAEKIMRILSETRLARSIIENGKRMVGERFSWEEIAKSYADIFQNGLMRLKKILITTGLFPPEIGGPATYSKLLHDQLPNRGWFVTVAPFSCVRHLPRTMRHLAYCWQIIRAARYHDIIFAQDPVSVGFPSVIAAGILRKKCVLKIVGDYAWEQGVQRYGVKELLDEFLARNYGWHIALLRSIQKWSARHADHIVVPSQYLKKVVIQWGIAPEKISVIYNGFDALVPVHTKQQAREKLKMSGTVLVSVGRLVPWKGFGAMVALVAKLQRDIPDISAMIIGDGPDRARILKKIQENGLENKIELTGTVSREKVLEILSAGDVFLLNTGYEGFSHTLLEAMAMGIPVITTPVGGNTEIITNEKNGVFVQRDDIEDMRKAVMRIVRNHEFAKKIIEQAHIKAHCFNTERMLEETSALLKKT